MKQRTYGASDSTKHAMAESLKRLMAQKPLSKITIQEIADGCHMKRQNFYYHFEDIYDLVRWMFQEEALPLLTRHEDSQLWQDGLLQLFQYLQENQAVCLCALKSMGRDHIKRFFQADIYSLFHRTIENLITETGGTNDQLNMEFLTHFYVSALASTMESWLLGEIDLTPEELIHQVDLILTDTMRGLHLRIGQDPVKS